MKVLHIVPDSVANRRHLFLGSTKDIRNRTEYFKERGIPFDEILAKDRSDALLLDRLQSLNLNQYTVAFFEYPVYPASLRFMRRRFPNIKLLTRSHNAEFYQRLHYALARFQHMKSRRVITDLKGSISKLRLDYLCGKLSDYILSITEWEKNNYWKYLVAGVKVLAIPYFLPVSYSKFVLDVVEKKLQCVCMMSTTQGTLPLTLDAAKTFSNLVGGLDGQCSHWSFVITGDFAGVGGIRLAERITHTGLLKSPFEVLAESRAMALLSDYGFGFKTKLIEAILCKCYILVTRNLYKRLPVEAQPYCIVVDKHSLYSFRNALERSLEPFPGGNPNDIFRLQAFTALDGLIYPRR